MLYKCNPFAISLTVHIQDPISSEQWMTVYSRINVSTERKRGLTHVEEAKMYSHVRDKRTLTLVIWSTVPAHVAFDIIMNAHSVFTHRCSTLSRALDVGDFPCSL